MSDATKLRQVEAQCRVVSHLATALAQIYEDYASIFAEGGRGPEDIADTVGERTARLMEDLGDILNGMDAVTEDDEWTHPVFREAQRRWPVTREAS